MLMKKRPDVSDECTPSKASQIRKIFFPPHHSGHLRFSHLRLRHHLPLLPFLLLLLVLLSNLNKEVKKMVLVNNARKNWKKKKKAGRRGT